MQWNIFRYIADFTHLASIILLLYKMISMKTCVGVSLKTHILYLSIYLLRYCNPYLLDPPFYNIFFKFTYIGSSITIIALILTKYKRTYEKRHDNFRTFIIYIVCAPIAYFTSPVRSIWHFTNCYSLWLEAFAILPQLFLITRSRKVDVMNKEYIFLLSIYRLFYLINWVYKAVTETGSTPKHVWASGTLQTVIYSDFIYTYIRMKVQGGDFELPY